MNRSGRFGLKVGDAGFGGLHGQGRVQEKRSRETHGTMAAFVLLRYPAQDVLSGEAHSCQSEQEAD